jgi:hypothetical protein
METLWKRGRGYRRARMDPRRKLLPQEMPTFERDLEMARMRMVDGLTLEEIGARTGVGRERSPCTVASLLFLAQLRVARS